MRAEHTCPECHGVADHMPVLSAVGAEDYYLCRSCQHVTMAPKDLSFGSSAKAASTVPARDSISAERSDRRVY
jgi:hypothetical protein